MFMDQLVDQQVVLVSSLMVLTLDSAHLLSCEHLLHLEPILLVVLQFRQSLNRQADQALLSLKVRSQF